MVSGPPASVLSVLVQARGITKTNAQLSGMQASLTKTTASARAAAGSTATLGKTSSTAAAGVTRQATAAKGAAASNTKMAGTANAASSATGRQAGASKAAAGAMARQAAAGKAAAGSNAAAGASAGLAATRTKNIAVAAGAVTVAAGAMGISFTDEMQKIVSLVGVSQKQVDAWKGDLLELGPKVAKGPKELAEAMFFITSAGAQGSDALDILEASAKASAAGLGETKVVADAATSAMNAYGSDVLSASRATDVLTVAVREGKLEADQLAPAIGQAIPLASAMGVQFHEVAAAMAGMSRTGTNAATAATQTRAILTGLIKPASQSADAMKEMGTSADEVRKSLKERGLLATLQDLMERTNGNKAELAKLFPNVRALSGVLDLLGGNADANVKTFGKLAKATGASEKAFKDSQTAGFRLRQGMALLKSSLTSVGLFIEKGLGPALEFIAGFDYGKAFAGLKEFVGGDLDFSRVADAFRNLGTAISWAVENVIGPAAELLWPILETQLKGVLKVVGGTVKLISSLLTGDWSAAFDGLKQVVQGVFMAAFAPAIVIVKAMAGALSGVLDFISPVTNAFKAAGEWVGRAASNTTGFVSALLPVKAALLVIGSAASVAFAIFKGAIQVAWEVGKGFIGYTKALANVLAAVLFPAVRLVASIVKSVLVASFKVASTVVQEVWKNVKNMGRIIAGVVAVVSNLLRGDWAGAWRSMRKLLDTIFKAILRSWKSLWNVAKSVFSNTLGVFKTVAKSGMDAVGDAVRGLGKSIPGVFRTAWNAAKSIFAAGANAVFDVVAAVVNVINKIPGVNIELEKGSLGGATAGNLGRQTGGIIPGSGDGDKVPRLLPQGAFVMNKKATEAYGLNRGGMVPTLLEPGERTFMPGEVRKFGLGRLMSMNETVSRFQNGGPVGMDIGGIAGDIAGVATGAVDKAKGVVSGAANLAMKGPGFFTGLLPDPNIPEPFTGVGPYLIDKAKDFIKDKVNPANLFGGGGGGDVNGLLPQVKAALAFASGHGWSGSVTSGFRTYAEQAALYAAYRNGTGNLAARPGTSNHEGGEAVDVTDTGGFGAAMGQMGPGRLYSRIAGEPWHYSITGYQQGGIVDLLRKMAIGGGVDINRTFPGAMYPGSAWSSLPTLSFNVAAALAEAAGDWAGTDMPGITFAQMSKGEGALKPGSMGDDNGDGSPDGYGWLAITRPYGDSYGVSKFGGYGKMLNPVLNAAVAAKMYGSQGTGAWYGDRFVTNKNAHYGGPYDIRKSLGGKTFAQAVGDPGSGGGGMSAAEKERIQKRKETARRRENREKVLGKIWGRANDSKTQLGKKGGLLSYVKQFALYGKLEKGDHSKILDAVKAASGTLNPAGGISRLRGLSKWMRTNVDVSGEESTNEKFLETIKKAQGSVRERAGKKRNRKLKGISSRGLKHPWMGDLAYNDNAYAKYEELIGIAEQNASAESGPGGSELTDAEVQQQIGLNQFQLYLQQRRKGFLGSAIGYAASAGERYRGLIKKASKKNSPMRWKLGAFKKGLANSKTTGVDLRESLAELVGVTGQGGTMFDTKLRLKELGVTTTVEKAAAAERAANLAASTEARDSEIADILRESLAEVTRKFNIGQAQMPIFEQFMPKYHSGGIIPGQGEKPVMALGGEGYFTRDQMAALAPVSAGSGDITLNATVYVNGVKADPAQVRMEIENVGRNKVRRARDGNHGPQASLKGMG